MSSYTPSHDEITITCGIFFAYYIPRALLLVTLGFFVHACISSPDEMSDAERAAANAELGEVKNEESSKHSGQPPTLPHISPLN